jgi:undecaprenyldiphospho-muramoylpentapeptide beta-N-acetylglucosaminyltransferase
MRSPGKPAALEVLLTGGGTAGHVVPALAVARGLVESGLSAEELHFVGARRGIEARLVTEAGFTITLLPARGIKRRLSVRNLTALLGMFVALLRATALEARRRPGVVVTFGGYAGLPAALAAALLRIPLVVVNLDSVPGASNRLAGRFARVCALAFPGAALPHSELTGAPLREEVLSASRTEEGRQAARLVLGVDEGRSVLVVVGGSLGAERLNVAAFGLAEQLATRQDLVLFHVAGARNYERVAQTRERLGLGASGLDYRVVPFVAELPALFSLAALVVSRAGAMTVAEIAAIGVPSILVPLPHAPADHQRLNTTELENAGGAIVVADEEATPERLVALVEKLLANPEGLEEMGRAAASVGRRDATTRVVQVLSEILGDRGGRQ